MGVARLLHRARGVSFSIVVSAAPGIVFAQSGRDASRTHPNAGSPYAAAPARPAPAPEPTGSPVSITIEGGARRMLVGATVPHTARLRDASGAERRDLLVQWTSSDPNVASVNQFGVVTAVRPGPVTIRAVAGSLSTDRRYVVEANPIKSLTLSITADQVKTGDVVEVSAMAFDASGYKVPNVPFLYTFTAAVEDSAVGQLAPADLDQEGRFVAQKAGDYQIIAVAPGLVAHRTIRVANRNVGETARIAGRAPLAGAQLSDVVAWRGRDGREFALACGSGSRSQLMSYEIFEDALKPLDTLTVVDAKGVTDCVVDTEAGLAAIVRDGGNGRSSIAVLDVNEPRAMKSLGVIDDNLGGVSGIAVYRRHLFAVSDAHRLEVISVEDPARPRRVASLELGSDRGQAGGAGAPTDVTVTDGIAYVALGRSGMAMVDVGNGKFGGSPAKPTRIAGFRAPFASTHAAYAYRSRTGKWYAILSEDLPSSSDVPTPSGVSGQPGFARIVDFSDPAHPEEVARYEVPEAGVQDLWVEGDRLYVAAQNGGVRVVDVSADLKGNLYHQGREIARVLPTDGTAAPNVTSVHAIRGGLLAGDRSTGLWLVKLSNRN